MKTHLRFLLTLLALSLPTALSAQDASADKAKNCGCACCKDKEVCCCNAEATAAPKPVTHPLKGVIVGVMPEKTALLVKHEAIPGVMRAMTMMFKVEPAVLEKVKRGDALRARMGKRDDGWWLTEVEVVRPAK
jgi:Cu/Ag efflux protein CusF